MRTQVRFRTTLFAPLTDESDQRENGRELAEWLRAQLPAAMQADAMDEDWGWRVRFGAGDLDGTLSVCCGHVEADQWSCACVEIRSFTDKLLRRPLPQAQMERVVRAIDALLDGNPAFTDVEWFANDARLRESDHAPRPFAGAR
jgi:hypothetical protein